MTPEQQDLSVMVSKIENFDLRDDQYDLEAKAIEALNELKMSFEDEWGQPVGEQPLMGSEG